MPPRRRAAPPQVALQFQGLPTELSDLVITHSIDPRRYDLNTITEFPHREPIPLHLRTFSKHINETIITALSTQWLWISFIIQTCDRSCQHNEDPILFNTWWRKTRYHVRHHFHEVPLERINRITGNRTPTIEITLFCCETAYQNISTTRRPDIVGCFAAGELINQRFSSFLGITSEREYMMVFDMYDIRGGDREMKQQVRAFMKTLSSFVRDVPDVWLDRHFKHIVRSRQAFRRSLKRNTERVTIPAPYNAVPELAKVLTRQCEDIAELMVAGFPLHFMLPWVLDIMTAYQAHWRMFTYYYTRTTDDDRRLAGSLSTLVAYACSGFAQYLLAKPNTRADQRHYTIPNRFHDQIRFKSGEYFWLRLIDQVSYESLEQDHWRNENFQQDLRHANPIYWCAVYQSCAELCIAFARASIVVGADDQLLGTQGGQADNDPMPDIRENNFRSITFAIPHRNWDGRLSAMRFNLARAAHFLRAIHQMKNVLVGGHRQQVIEWYNKYNKMWYEVNRALANLAHNASEQFARAKEVRIQRQATQANIHLPGRGKGARRIQRPPRRTQKPLIRLPTRHLDAPMLSADEIREDALQRGRYIEFGVPPYDEFSVMSWFDNGFGIRGRMDDQRYN